MTYVFFFQAEDGIRDYKVTGVQTCALPICRRRAAELKLEAAQQNLTRVDDIVFEVEKQRGALKRQAAKARRYKRLREALRRWEKVQFAQRYRVLGEAIDAARGRLADARARETGAAAHLA